jgi:hypothetical protein
VFMRLGDIRSQAITWGQITVHGRAHAGEQQRLSHQTWPEPVLAGRGLLMGTSGAVDPGLCHCGARIHNSNAGRSRERCGHATMALRDLVDGNNRPWNSVLRGQLVH